MGQAFMVHTDETAYNCRSCEAPVAEARQMICTKHQHQTWGSCFVFRNVINVKMEKVFPVELIDMGAYILLDDLPPTDVSNELSSHVFCSQCNDFLGWNVRSQNKYVLVRRKLT